MNIFGTTFDYACRLNRVRKLMDERGIDAMLVTCGRTSTTYPECINTSPDIPWRCANIPETP